MEESIRATINRCIVIRLYAVRQSMAMLSGSLETIVANPADLSETTSIVAQHLRRIRAGCPKCWSEHRCQRCGYQQQRDHNVGNRITCVESHLCVSDDLCQGS